MSGFTNNQFAGMIPMVSPRLLDNNHAQLAVNVNLTSGELRPLYSLLKIGNQLLSRAGVKLSMYRFGQDATDDTQYWFHWDSLVNVVRGFSNNETRERTYYTGDGVPKMAYSPFSITSAPYPNASYNLGIPTPTMNLGLTASDQPITSITKSGTTATVIVPAAHGKATGDSLTITGASDALYNGQFKITVLDSYSWAYTMTGTPAANAAGTLGYNWGGIAESRVYAVTFKSSLGEEGAPAVSNMISVYAGQTVYVTDLPPTPSGSYNIVTKRLYRTASGSTQSTLRYVSEVDIAISTYTDNIATSNLAENIPSLYYLPPPSDLLGIVPFSNGMITGISPASNTVCICEPFQPHAWPIAYQYSFNRKPVALGTFGSTIVVLTEGIPAVLTGTDPSSMSQSDIKFGQPCVSRRSVVELAGGVMWASDEGLAFVSPNGFDVATKARFTEREWKKYKPSSIQAYRWKNRYVAFYDNGTKQGGFIFDSQTGEFSEIDFYATAGFTDPRNGDLYLAVGDDVYKMDNNTASNLTYTWRSRVFVAPKPINIGYGKIKAETYNNLTLKLYADGVLIDTSAITDENIFSLPSGYLATQFEFEFTGTDIVKGYAFTETAVEIESVAE
jgi:hypothetical protein